jgi:hypothetical protein
VISYSNVRPAKISFNVPGKFNGWWDNDDWRTMYDYVTEYGQATHNFSLKPVGG